LGPGNADQHGFGVVAGGAKARDAGTSPCCRGTIASSNAAPTTETGTRRSSVPAGVTTAIAT